MKLLIIIGININEINKKIGINNITNMKDILQGFIIYHQYQNLKMKNSKILIMIFGDNNSYSLLLKETKIKDTNKGKKTQNFFY